MAQTKVQLLQPDLGDVIDFDASTLFVDGADNRIGIRNTNPQYELDVTGTINATNFRGNISVGTIDDWITHTGDTNTKFGFPAADTFAVETNGTEKLRIVSNGKMGLGTNNPTQYFHVVGNSASVQTEESGGGIVRMQSGGSVGYVGTYSNHPLLLQVNSQEKLRITSGGNLKAPDGAKIELGGAQTGAGDLSIWHDSGGNSYIKETGGGALVINADDFYLQNVATTTLLRTHSSGAIELTFNGTKKLETDNDGIRIGSGGGDNTIVDLHNASYDNGVIQYYNGSIALKTGSSNGDRTFQVHTGGSERFRIANDGKWTIKNANGMMLDLQSSAGTGMAWIEFSDTDGTRKGYLGYGSSGSEKVYWVQQKAANMSMYSNGNDRFEVQSDGQKIVKNGRLNINSTFIDFSGSISAPSTAAALFRPADNTLAISTANVERFRVDSTGNIHLRSATTNRIVLGSAGGSAGALTNNENWIRGSGTMVQLNTAGGDYGFEVLGSQKMKLDSSGNLELRSASQCRITFGSAGGSGNDTNWIRGDANKLMYNCRTGGGFDWEVNGTLKMAVSENGRLLLKTDPLAPGGTMGDRGIVFQASSTPTNGQVIQGITFNPHATSIGRARAGIAALAHGSSHPQSGADLAFMTRYSADGHDLDVTADQRLRIDVNGDFLFNTPTRSGMGIWNMNGQDQRARYQFWQTTGNYRGAAFHENRGDSNAFDMVLSKSRNGDGTGVINSGDLLGRIIFSGADGTRQVQGAMIQVYTTGTIASNRMPGKMLIKTGADHASSGLQNLLILNERQNVQHSGGATWMAATTNGDFDVVVRGLTNNAGNNWRKCGVFVQYNGINADATSSKSFIGYYGVGSVSTWNWLGEDEELTSDSCTVSIHDAASTSFRLRFNVADNNTGSVSVMVNAYGNSWPNIQIIG